MTISSKGIVLVTGAFTASLGLAMVIYPLFLQEANPVVLGLGISVSSFTGIIAAVLSR